MPNMLTEPITLIDTRKSPTQNGKLNIMDFTTFVRKPFTVQAVEITAENIEEVSKLVGDLKEKEDGTPYILVDNRLIPNVPKVYIGYFMTKMGENIRCYSRKIFNDQFVEMDENSEAWVRYMNGDAANVEAPSDTPTDDEVLETEPVSVVDPE